MNLLITILAALAALILLSVLFKARNVTTVYPPHVGLLYRNGKFERELEPGRYVFFDPFKRVHITWAFTAARPVTFADFPVVSKDQFAFRIGLSPVIEVVDARAFIESQPFDQPAGVAVHFAMQPLAAAAAHEAATSYGLRELLADPALISTAIQQKLESAIPGARVGQVLVTSITLPPETRKMFTEVERAKMEAEASLERARGEQAAMRALANAARLIKDNPALANLRFLQMLEQAPGAKTIVLGSDAVLPLTGGTTG